MLGSLLRALLKELENYPALQNAEDALGIRKLNLLLLAGPVMLFFRFFFGIRAANAMCNLVGFLYPALASIRSINNRKELDNTLWLTYFVVMSAFTIVEQLFFSRLLVIFPFYFSFKLGWLIWAQAPSTRGAIFVYSHILTPFIKNHSVIPATRGNQRPSVSNDAHF